MYKPPPGGSQTKGLLIKISPDLLDPTLADRRSAWHAYDKATPGVAVDIAMTI
jgi:hypothetical protein